MTIVAMVLLGASCLGMVHYLHDYVKVCITADSFLKNASTLIPAFVDDKADETTSVRLAKEAVRLYTRESIVGLTVHSVYVIFLVSYLCGG